MKLIYRIVVIAIVISLFSCKTTRVGTNTMTKDSTHISEVFNIKKYKIPVDSVSYSFNIFDLIKKSNDTIKIVDTFFYSSSKNNSVGISVKKGNIHIVSKCDSLDSIVNNLTRTIKHFKETTTTSTNTIEVEKPLGWFKKTAMILGYISMIFFVLILLFLTLLIFLKIKR